MRTTKAIRNYIREELILAIERKAAKYEDEEWQKGIPGALVEGRILTLQEILDWIDEE